MSQEHEMKAREGDFIETVDGLIFDVKGLVHPPPAIIAYVRYLPDENGERQRKRTRFTKVYSLQERFEFLRAKFPPYLVYDSVFDETLCEIAIERVRKHYRPIEKVQQLLDESSEDTLENKAIKLVNSLMTEANLPQGSLGISGSILLELHRANSDIDVIVYGSQNCRKVHSMLRNQLAVRQVSFRSYCLEELKTLFDFRSKDTAVRFEDFVKTEQRKFLQGKFEGTDYFIRFVKDWNEIAESYGDIHYRNLGDARIKATVADGSESIFTPCSYALENVIGVEGCGAGDVSEIVSFRGRFCEQAKKGESVMAQGKLERVINVKENREHLRLLIGNKPSDFMILV